MDDDEIMMDSSDDFEFADDQETYLIEADEY